MKTPVHVDLWYSATWNDITTDVRSTPEHQITISGGQQNWLSRVSPTKCDLALINTIIHPGDDPTKIGKYSPRNPESPLYGLIGRNNPLRVYVRWLLDDFGRTVASGWGTSASHLDSSNQTTALVGSLAWTTTGSGTGSAAVGSGVGTHTQTTANGFRLSHLASGANIRDCEVRCLVTADEADIDGGNIQPGNLILRLTDTSNYYYTRVQVTTAEAIQIGIRKVVGGVDTEIAAPVTVDGFTYTGQQLAVAFLADGPHLAAKVWAGTGREPFAWQVTGSDTSLGAKGAPGVRSGVASGNTDVPVTFTYDNLEVRSYRFTGEVEGWPQEWTLDADEDGNGVVWAPLVAYGLMYRLGLPGQDVLAQSSLERWYDPVICARMGRNAPSAHWALDAAELSEVGYLTSGSGGPFESVAWGTAQIEPGVAELAPWLGTGLRIRSDGVEARARLSLPAAPTRVTAETTFVFRPEPGEICAGFLTLAEVAETGGFSTTGQTWIVDVEQLADETRNIIVFGLFSGTPVVFETIPTPTTTAAGPHHVRLDLVQDGADIDWAVYLDGVSIDSGTATSRTLVQFKDAQLLYTQTVGEVIFGHVALYVDTTPPSIADTADAVQGHAGETAAARVARICEEENIQAFVFGTGQQMGPQPIAPPLELFIGGGEARDVDGGVFGERRHTLGLSYTAGRSLLNQGSSLNLNYASGEVASPSLHREDLDHCQNDVIVTRRDGASSARLVQETGPLNVSAPHTDPNGVGHYPVRPELNLAVDSQVDPIAGRLKWHGTTDGLRFAALGVDLTALYHASKTGVIGDVLAVDPGDKVLVQNIPTWLGAGDTGQIHRGFTELLGQFHWLMEHVTGPSEPFDVGEYAATPIDSSTKRYDTLYSTVDGALVLPGSAGAYASTPHSSDLGIVGDIDVRVDCAMTDWTPGAAQCLAAKWSGVNGSLSWQFMVETSGLLTFRISTDGTATTAASSSVAPTIGNGQRLAVRVTLDVNDGGGNRVFTFYTAPNMDGNWTQLGTVQTFAGTTSIFNATTTPVTVGAFSNGSSPAAGRFYTAQVLSSIGGTERANPIFSTQDDADTSFVDDAGNTWTVNGAAVLDTAWVAGTDTALVVNITPGGSLWTTKSTSFTGLQIEAGGAVWAVSSISGTATPQTITVTQTPVNGVVKSVTAGTRVRVAPAQRATRGT